MEQRTRDLNILSTTEEHDSFPFPIEPLRPISSTTSRNDLVCIVTILELLLHSLLLALLRYPLQFQWKHQRPIHLLLKQHSLLICRPGNPLAQFNILFVTVPLAWLETALNRAIKSPNIIDRSEITRSLSQY